ncbi:MAG: hypothetical protein Q7K42_04620 [Candidatus Diapherotrites archaeon]|nr:hypothetical protein [Candidatus Diapherotrites archaeon]
MNFQFFYRGRKAQESAPFELLIAIILMTFVIFVGMVALDKLQKSECDGKIEKQLEEISQALQSVTSNKGLVNLVVNFQGCGVNPDVRLKDEADAYICNVFCGSQKRTCSLLHFTAKSIDDTKIKCVNISALTEFKSNLDSGPCEKRDTKNLILVDWDTDNIDEGIYTITSPFSLSTIQIPTVCVYKKNKL